MPLPGLLDALKARDGVVLRMDDDDLPHESASGPAKSKANRSRDRYSTSGGSKTSFGLQPALSWALALLPLSLPIILSNAVAAKALNELLGA